jgi:hypothetical protein
MEPRIEKKTSEHQKVGMISKWWIFWFLILGRHPFRSLISLGGGGFSFFTFSFFGRVNFLSIFNIAMLDYLGKAVTDM